MRIVSKKTYDGDSIEVPGPVGDVSVDVVSGQNTALYLCMICEDGDGHTVHVSIDTLKDGGGVEETKADHVSLHRLRRNLWARVTLTEE